MSQLRSLGTAISLYANENRGQVPPNLATLAITQDFPISIYICPSSKDKYQPTTSPSDVVGALAQPGHCSYEYIGRGTLKSLTRDDVIAYEAAGNHGGDFNVLFGDLHVESLDAATTKAVFDQVVANAWSVRLPKARVPVLGPM